MSTPVEELEALLGAADTENPLDALKGDEEGNPLARPKPKTKAAVADDADDEDDEAAAEVASKEASDEDEAPSAEADAPDEGMDVADFATYLGVEEGTLVLPEGEDGNVLFKVTVDGEQSTATLKDLVKSYQLDKSLYGKHEALSGEREKLVAERQQAHQSYMQKLQDAEDLIRVSQSALGQEFQDQDWKALEERDPGLAALERQKYAERYQALNSRLGAIEEHRRQEMAQAEAMQQQQLHAYQTREWGKLLAAIPEFGDDAKRDPLVQEMRKYLQSYGYSEQEFSKVMDHRLMRVIHDGLRYQALAKNAKPDAKRVVKLPKRLKPGASRAPETAQREKAAAILKRAARSGSDRDAAAAFLAIGAV